MLIERDGQFAYECDQCHAKTESFPTENELQEWCNFGGEMLKKAWKHGVDARGKPDPSTHICWGCRALYGFLF